MHRLQYPADVVHALALRPAHMGQAHGRRHARLGRPCPGSSALSSRASRARGYRLISRSRPARPATLMAMRTPRTSPCSTTGTPRDAARHRRSSTKKPATSRRRRRLPTMCDLLFWALFCFYCFLAAFGWYLWETRLPEDIARYRPVSRTGRERTAQTGLRQRRSVRSLNDCACLRLTPLLCIVSYASCTRSRCRRQSVRTSRRVTTTKLTYPPE